MLLLIEEQDQSPFQLTDEQLAEVRRRRADKDAKLLTLEEFDRATVQLCFGIIRRPFKVRLNPQVMQSLSTRSTSIETSSSSSAFSTAP